MKTAVLTVLLLVGSNTFMITAWYWHLKFEDRPIWLVILISWGIAFFEYCLQVPANRWGYGIFSAYQLKIIQEAVTLVVFMAFAFLYLHEKLRWNYAAAFACIMAAVFFAFLPQIEKVL